MPRTDPEDGVLTPARSLSGRYELLGRLGSGGMAEVYLARAVGLSELELEKIVVLKRVLPSRVDDPRYLAMFRDEARVAATLEHPNIVHTHDIGVQGDECFFTMEYLHGEDLKAVLSAAKKAGEALPLELALQIAIGCAAGLHHAHEQTDYAGHPLGIVHRDISPSNVIVTRQSGVKLIDFGIAKAASDKEQTGVGVIKGKAAYMSPEQCRGEVLDRRSDLFAMGIVLFEMVTMRRPFVADSVLGTVHEILQSEPPNVAELRPECPPALARIIDKALHKSPAERYQSAFEMQEELELATRDCGLLALPGALGRYLEHLFGPKPHPWTERANKPPAVPRWAWAQLDSTLTASRPGALPRPAKVVVAPSPAPPPMVTAPAQTAPGHAALGPVGSPGMETPGVETRSSDTSLDMGEHPTTAGYAPVTSGAWAVKHLMVGGLLGGLIAIGGLSLWMSVGDDDVEPRARPQTAASLAPPSAPAPEPRGLEVEPSMPELEPSAPGPGAPEPEPGLDEPAGATESPEPTEPEPEPEPNEEPMAASPRRGSAADASQLLARARKHIFSDPSQTYRDAKRAYEIEPDQEALLVMGFAACRMKSEPKARFAYRRLRGEGKTEMESACLQKGIDLR